VWWGGGGGLKNYKFEKREKILKFWGYLKKL